MAIVTGGYSGLGLETTRALAGAGAHVIVPSRRHAVAKEALAELEGSVEVEELDLADLGSVRAFTGRVLNSARSVDVLINNAGIMACPETRVAENREAQFATNHLGHFVLTCELWPALTAAGGARVVSLSSTGRKGSASGRDPIGPRTVPKVARVRSVQDGEQPVRGAPRTPSAPTTASAHSPYIPAGS